MTRLLQVAPLPRCETSKILHKNLDPLEHSVLVYAGPAGRHVAVGPVGPFRMLSSSNCHPAGLAGPYFAGALLAQIISGTV